MKREFVTGCWYHVMNRGVEMRDIFLDTDDYEKFLFHLFECNSVKNLPDLPHWKRTFTELLRHGISGKDDERLVDVGAFALMPNHLHLLIKQRVDGGISEFMRKTGLTYVKGFNSKYNRVGPLYQGAFKAKLVDKDEYFRWVLAYILTNPIELRFPNWRENKIKDIEGMKKFLSSYQYSSYGAFVAPDYNFNFVINKPSLFEIIEDDADARFIVHEFIAGDEVNEHPVDI